MGTIVVVSEPLEFQSVAWGDRLPARYGAVEDEHLALREDWVLYDRSWTTVVEMTGEDRVRFLNGLITSDVRELGEGDGQHGFVTDAKGKVVTDVGLFALEDRLWMEAAPGKAAHLAEHLGKYVITDRVELAVLEEQVAVALCGPRAEEALGSLVEGELPGADWGHRAVDLADRAAWLCRHPRLGVDGFVVRASRTDAEEIRRRLVADDGGPREVGHHVMEAARIAAGLPLAGVDLDEATLPQETGEEGAISYTKGCYLGQEVVARVHYLGKVNRTLRGLRFEDGTLPELGAELSADGRPVGRVTSAVRIPGSSEFVGLALLHRKGAEVGERLSVDGGAHAVVTELPTEDLPTAVTD